MRVIAESLKISWIFVQMPSDTPTICLPDTTARLALYQIFQLLMGSCRTSGTPSWLRQRGGMCLPSDRHGDSVRDYIGDAVLRQMRGTVRISAGPQVFDLLVYLIRNRHRVVSKDDLLGAVWQGRIVSELTLTSHVNALRKAIGDSGNNQKVILTVPRKGFRFVAQVRKRKRPLPSILTAPLPAMSAALSLPDRPSIAVMPFRSI